MSALKGPIWSHNGASFYSLRSIIRHCNRTWTPLPPVAQRMMIAQHRAYERHLRDNGWDYPPLSEDEILDIGSDSGWWD